MTSTNVDITTLKWTQSTIKETFSDETPVSKTIQDLKTGIITYGVPGGIPTIHVYRDDDGVLWALDNRRLYCMREALKWNRNKEIQVIVHDSSDPERKKEFERKKTTCCEGYGIRVKDGFPTGKPRQGKNGGWYVYTKKNVKKYWCRLSSKEKSELRAHFSDYKDMYDTAEASRTVHQGESCSDLSSDDDELNASPAPQSPPPNKTSTMSQSYNNPTTHGHPSHGKLLSLMQSLRLMEDEAIQILRQQQQQLSRLSSFYSSVPQNRQLPTYTMHQGPQNHSVGYHQDHYVSMRSPSLPTHPSLGGSSRGSSLSGSSRVSNNWNDFQHEYARTNPGSTVQQRSAAYKASKQ
eukprot:PhF_6_TR3398/c3_g1_i1/m.4872